MNLKEFKKLLSAHLYPVLRAEGFKGSGATLRRINGPLVHVFNVQGSSYGELCYLNLGAHLTFLTPNLPAEKLLEYQCKFRTRIKRSGKSGDWNYGNSMTEARANIDAAVTAWQIQGREFFKRYEIYPDHFTDLVTSFSPGEDHPAMCLTMARIARHLGMHDRARIIAESGIRQASDEASVLRNLLTVFLQTNS